MSAQLAWRPTWPKKDNPLADVHGDLIWIAPIFIMAMRCYGGTATVNYGTNGTHSLLSAHGKGRALDIHHKDMRFSWVKGVFTKEWYFALVQFAATLVTVLNAMARLTNSQTEFYLVTEPGHFHLEITLHGEAPNIKGWTPDLKKYHYIHADVRKILEAA